jgi:hypothetical protein
VREQALDLQRALPVDLEHHVLAVGQAASGRTMLPVRLKVSALA